MHLYGKEDLAKLKDSKPISVICHTHEAVIPVVYAGMVNRFLKSKGVELPLTHHALADMKREAGTPGYAVGSKGLKSKKGKKKPKKGKTGNVNQTVVVNVTRPVRATRPTGAKTLYDKLRPSHPIMSGIKTLSGNIPDPEYAKALRDEKEKEKDALEHYKKEVDSRVKQIEQLQNNAGDAVRRTAPMVASSSQPLRRNDFESTMEQARQDRHAMVQGKILGSIAQYRANQPGIASQPAVSQQGTKQGIVRRFIKQVEKD
jgi:hypothetical protein